MGPWKLRAVVGPFAYKGTSRPLVRAREHPVLEGMLGLGAGRACLLIVVCSPGCLRYVVLSLIGHRMGVGRGWQKTEAAAKSHKIGSKRNTWE